MLDFSALIEDVKTKRVTSREAITTQRTAMDAQVQASIALEAAEDKLWQAVREATLPASLTEELNAA